MDDITDIIVKEGMEMTSTSNIKSFVKKIFTIEDEDVKTEVLKNLFKHHYSRGSSDIFDKIRDELRSLEGLNAPNLSGYPSAPRGQWYNVVMTPDGLESILIGDIIYTKPKNTSKWSLKGGNSQRKTKRKSLRRKRKSRKQK